MESIRESFPILQHQINDHPLVYLDSAATAQVPAVVLDAMREFDETARANVHRGMHQLADRATQAYEDARSAVQRFINAKYSAEICFTKNCTEAMNVIAKGWGASLEPGDVIVLSLLEHHSNIVPWQMLQTEKGIDVQWIGIDDDGQLTLDELDAYLAAGNVKLVAVTGQSNVLGIRPDLPAVIAKAHAAGALVLVDAAQLAVHHSIDVQALDCDFLAFSGHKVYGPTGIGVLYGKRDLLEAMPPALGGGGMIHEVKQAGFSPAEIPQRFEAGTPPITQAVGLAAAIDWLTQFDWQDIETNERELITAAIDQLKRVDGLTILGSDDADLVSGCVSFVVDGIHPHDLTEILGQQGLCLRAGHHCTQPLHEYLDHPASTRLSVGIYNTVDEFSVVAESINAARETLT